MAYKKYITRNGKKYGPYYYESHRENGKVINRYVRPDEIAAVSNSSSSGFSRFRLILIGVIVLAAIAIFLVVNSLQHTGNVSLSLQTSYVPGEKLQGNINFGLVAGEFVPAGSRVVLQLGNQSKELLLSELVDMPSGSGDFFAEGTLLNGSGEGYGGNESLSIDVDLSKFNVSAEEGLLSVKLVYGDVEIAAAEEEIIISESAPENASGANETNVTSTNFTSEPELNDTNLSLKSGINLSVLSSPPAATLIAPANGNVTVVTSVNFSCNATDDVRLTNLTFYWNVSGSWAANGTVNVSGIRNQTSFLRINLTNGFILWNCRACDNESQCVFASSNWTVRVNDSIIPVINSVSASPNPAVKNQVVNITANVTDNFQVANVTLRVNGTNYSMGFVGNNLWLYSLSTSNLSVGIVNYTVYANDTNGNNAVVVNSNFSISAPVLTDPLRSGSEFLLYVPPLNKPTLADPEQPILVVTAFNDNTTLYIEDLTNKNYSVGNSTNQTTLNKGQSIIVFPYSPNTGDYFYVSSSKTVTAVVKTKSPWTSYSASSEGRDYSGEEYFIYARYDVKTNASEDLVIFAYENNTHIRIYDVTGNITNNDGVDASNKTIIATGDGVLTNDIVLNKGEHVAYIGNTFIPGGHTARIVSNRRAGVIGGSLTEDNNGRDGGFYVGSVDGKTIGTEFYTYVGRGLNLSEDMLYFFGTVAANITVDAYYPNLTLNRTFSLQLNSTNNYFNTLLYTGSQPYKHITSTDRMSILAGTWIQAGTGDIGDFAPSSLGGGIGKNFNIYIPGPSTQNYTHAIVFAYYNNTLVHIYNKTNGYYFGNRTLNFKDHWDFNLTYATLLTINSTQNVAVEVTNYDDNIAFTAVSVPVRQILVDKFSNLDTVDVGDYVNYTINLTNSNDVNFYDVVATDVLGNGLTFVGSSEPGGVSAAVVKNNTPGVNQTTITWNVSVLGAGETKSIVLVVRVNSTDYVQQNHISAVGVDAEGNYVDGSDVAIVFLFDKTYPNVTNVSANPNPQFVNQIVNITAIATDNWWVSTAIVSVNGTNYTMNRGSDNLFYYLYNGTTVGTFNYTVYVTDSSGHTTQSGYYTFSIGQGVITSLNAPAAGYSNGSEVSLNVTFNCSASTSVGNLTNVSLYITNRSNQGFALNRTTNLSGKSNSTNWTLNLLVGNYTWNCLSKDNGGNSAWGALNRTVEIYYSENVAPSFLLIGPTNGSVDVDGAVLFNLSETDNSALKNASLYINGVLNQTINLSGVSNATLFSLILPNGNYNWSIIVYDNSGNYNSSETRLLVVNTSSAPVYNLSIFSGNTTNWTNIPDVTNVCNGTAVLDNPPTDKIQWYNCVNALGANFNVNVNLSYNFVNVSFGLHSSFNSSATITIRNLSWDATPDVYVDGVICSSAVCSNVSYNVTTGVAIFNVSHFTSFVTGSNSRLEIWDETDANQPYANQTRYPNQTTRFFANYTVRVSGAPITTANCNISFTDSLANVMTYNSTILMYEYRRNFSSNGTFAYNVTCRATGRNTLTTNDSVIINVSDTTAPAIYLITPQNNSLTNISAQVFGCNITDNTAIANLTLYLWNSTSLILANTSVLTGASNFSNYSYVLPYDSTFKWNCLGYDSARNSNWSANGNYSITLDRVAPFITIVSPSATTYNNRTILVNISTTGASYVWFFNGTANVTYTAPVLITFPEGSTTIIAYANDSAGNLNMTSVTFRVDTTAPTAIIPSPQNGTITNQPYQNFTLNASDATGIANATLNIYNQTGLYNRTTVSLGGVTQATVSIVVWMADGIYNWFWQVVDIANNLASTQQLFGNYTLTEDTVSPLVSIVNPQNTTYNNETLLVSLSTAGASSVWFNWNGTNQTYTTPVYVTFAEGSNILTAYASDSAGNMNSSSVAFVVDVTAPVISLDSPNNVTYGNSSVLINFTADSYQALWFFNGTTNVSYTTPVYMTFADGSHSIVFYANDSAGNIGELSLVFGVNTSLPSIDILSPENITYNNRTILLNISDSGVHTWYEWNGTNVTYTGVVYVTFEEGNNVLRAWTNNSLGLVNTVDVSFSVDTSAPVFNSSSIGPVPGSQINQTGAVPIDIEVNENSTVTANISWDSTSQIVNLTYNGTQWYYNFTLTNVTYPGFYNITINVTDALGNSNTTITNFTVEDIVSPSVDVESPAAGAIYYPLQVVNVTANVTDLYYDSISSVIAQITYPNGTIVNYSLVEIDDSQIFDDLLFNIPNLTGTYNILLVANDSSGNSNSTTSWFDVIPVDVVSPIIINTTLEPYDPSIGGNVSLSIFASDDVNISGKFANITLPNGTVITISLPSNYLPPISGRYNVTFWTNDTSGNIASFDDYFIVGLDEINITFNVINSNLSGIPVNLTVYFAGTDKEVHEHEFNGSKIDRHSSIFYDLYFQVIDGGATIRLNGINLSMYPNDTLGVDRNYSIPGYLVVYGLNATYGFTNAIIQINYSGISYTNESNLILEKCGNWDFINWICLGGWVDITAQSIQNTSEHYFSANVSSFSGFGVREPSASVPSSSGGGTGGKKFVVAPQLGEADIGFGSNLIEISLFQGESKLQPLSLISRDTREFNVNASVWGLDSLLSVSGAQFVLSAGDTGQLMLNFYAPMQQKPGIYAGRVVVDTGFGLKIINVIVTVKERRPLFDMIVDVTPETKRVYAEDSVNSVTLLHNIGLQKEFNVTLVVSVRDLEKNLLFEVSRGSFEMKGNDSFASINNRFMVPRNFAPGKYMVLAEATYDNGSAESYDTFEVLGRGICCLVWLSLIVLELILLLILLIPARKRQVPDKVVRVERDLTAEYKSAGTAMLVRKLFRKVLVRIGRGIGGFIEGVVELVSSLVRGIERLLERFAKGLISFVQGVKEFAYALAYGAGNLFLVLVYGVEHRVREIRRDVKLSERSAVAKAVETEQGIMSDIGRFFKNLVYGVRYGAESVGRDAITVGHGVRLAERRTVRNAVQAERGLISSVRTAFVRLEIGLLDFAYFLLYGFRMLLIGIGDTMVGFVKGIAEFVLFAVHGAKRAIIRIVDGLAGAFRGTTKDVKIAGRRFARGTLVAEESLMVSFRKFFAKLLVRLKSKEVRREEMLFYEESDVYVLNAERLRLESEIKKLDMEYGHGTLDTRGYLGTRETLLSRLWNLKTGRVMIE